MTSKVLPQYGHVAYGTPWTILMWFGFIDAEQFGHLIGVAAIFPESSRCWIMVFGLRVM